MTNSNTNVEVIETPETPEVIEPVAAEPVVETPVVTPEPAPEPDFKYEYQPVDELGRPLGAKQVFKGSSMQEVLDKVAKAHQESIKLTRELKKNLRLGNIEQEEIPETVVRYGEDIDFQPVQLSEEERYELARDLQDPEKFNEASAKLFEATIGARPEVIRQTLAEVRQTAKQISAQKEAEIFVQANPEYYVCRDNFETMTNWMVKNRLAPTRENFQFAFDKLKAVGLLLEAPIVREEPVPTPEPEVVPEPVVVTESPVNSQPEPEPNSRITVEEPQPQTKRPTRVASGLNRNIASDADVTPTKSGTLTLEMVEKMSSDEYKKRMRDPKFREEVDRLYAPKSR